MSSLDRLKALLAEEAGLGEDMITEETRLSALGFDSLRALELLFHVEQEFGVRLDRRPYETVGDLAHDL